MSELTIWGGGTSRTMRAHWMCHELGLQYQSRLIGSRSGATDTEAFVKLNPKRKIPVLVDDQLVLTESAAIVTYLGDTYGGDSGLVPPPFTLQRALYNQWSSFVQMELDAHTLYIIRKHRDLQDIYGAAPAAVEEAMAGFDRQVAVAETALRQSQYLLGDAFTAADLLLASVLAWARAYGLPLAPQLQQYLSGIVQRPAYIAAGQLNFSIDPAGNPVASA